MPIAYVQWRIAFDTGWTLEYIKSLRYGDLVEYLEIKDAMAKAAM